MGVWMAFPICSVLYITLIIIIYFSKTRFKSIENDIYKAIIISCLIGLFLELGCYYAVDHISPSNYIFPMFILKAYVIYIFAWTLIFNIYVFIVTSKKHGTSEFDGKEYVRKIMPFTMAALAIFTIIVIILPLYVFNEGGAKYSYGLSVNIMIGLCFVLVITWLIKCIINIKRIKQKKYVPILVCLALLVLVAVLQSNDRSILLVTSAHAFVGILMYFTIENPDMKLINELNIARDRADKANLAKSEFLSNMSHEIRTPLNAIVGFSQSVLERDIPDNAKEDVNDIVTASSSLLEIVNGVLDISKIEANKLEIVNTEYSFKKIYKELLSLAKGRLGEKPLEFRAHFDDSIPPVLYGDHSRLKQIILNLLTNAIKYTQTGYVDFKVDCIVKDDICRLIVSVEDSGIGIKPEKIDSLFNKFERVDLEKNISIEGTGLGLAITKRLVELMNGKIVVQSVYGQGSRFTVAIDQRIIHKDVDSLESTQVIDVEAINSAGKRVLVVDDNKINLKVAARLLQNYEVEVEQVESGFDCIDRIMNGDRFDLILLDDMMPKMSGVETLKKLKQIATFNIPTVALTANAISGMREKYLKDGFDDYLPKPIDRNELSRVIKKFLDQ